MKPKPPVYVVSYCTESCDRGVYVFSEKPTKDFLDKFFREMMPEEYEELDGPRYEISAQGVRSPTVLPSQRQKRGRLTRQK